MNEFEAVYREHFRTVEQYLRALCHDEVLAEELTEQTFFQVLRALPAFRGQCDIRSWLCGIARNVYLSHLRKEKTLELPEDLPDQRLSVEERILDREQAMAIHRALHTLPEPYKEVFTLRVFGQLSFADIGGLFGKSQNWACVTYHRAKQKITDALEESK